MKLDGRFDVVFTSHGVLGWLPDLERWAQVIARTLAPGSLFDSVEVHPLLQFVERICLHPLSDVIGSLARAGLRIESFEEYPFLGGQFFPWMEEGADRWWRPPEDPRLPVGRGSRPLMSSAKASGPRGRA